MSERSTLWAMRRSRIPPEMAALLDRIRRRAEAIKSGCFGLIPVRCALCGALLPTTAAARESGEPAIVFDWPEHAEGYLCARCDRSSTFGQFKLHAGGDGDPS